MFYTSRRLIRRKRTVTYHGQYLTINSRISECDHKCESRNAEPEIGTDGSSQTRRNPLVDGYGSGFGPPRVCRSGFWTVLEPNRPVSAVQIRTAGGLPGPVANTTHETSKMICTVWSLKSRRKTRSFLEEIIISSNGVFKDCVSDMVVEIGKLGISTRETAENNDTLTQNVGF